MDFFIDESGNSGDLIHAYQSLAFDGQPIFTLAAVGIRDSAALADEIARLRAHHGVGGGELKSSAMTGRPGFARDLLAFSLDAGCPLFVEVVDKRYMLCAAIVNAQLLPPVAGVAEGPEIAFVRNTMADWLSLHGPDSVLAAFLDACRAPGEPTLRSALTALATVPDAGEPEIARAVRQCATTSLADFERECEQDAEAHLRYLPLADGNKRGRPVWLLAHLSSLTNLYARINRYRGRALAGVHLIHDEQLQFDRILMAAKAAVEALGDRAQAMYAPHSDFEFVEAASLEFANSSESVGLQAADILAGFVMRHVRDLAAGHLPDRSGMEAFGRLLAASDSGTGVGVNFVVPTPTYVALHRAHLVV